MHQKMGHVLTPKLCGRDLIWKKDLCILIKLRISRQDHPGLPGQVLDPTTCVLRRDQRGETQTQRRSHLETGAEFGVTWPQPKDA